MNRFSTVLLLVTSVFFFLGCGKDMNTEHELYTVNTHLESRSISFENITGAKGQGGKAVRPELGPGRKGAAFIDLEPGQTVQLCDIKGPGVIRHIWVTLKNEPELLNNIVIKAWWDGQEHPSVNTPIGNFFGVSYGLCNEDTAYESAVHSVNSSAGMNIWVPMPFTKNARITVTNNAEKATMFFFNIDYTINDKLAEDVGRLHVLYRRENPTTLKKDFEILPHRHGKGRYLGCVLAVRPLMDDWWGEGEVKIYLDGDQKYPTIVGSGTEDYIGQSWGLQKKTYLYGGMPYEKVGEDERLYAIYRWHIKDPIYWKEDIKVTIQQIGFGVEAGFFERQDDVSATTFWYEPLPSEPIPEPVW
jgi:hypothetical protein